MIERSALDWTIDDATARMRAATNVYSKLLWARRLVDAKRQRGDYDQVVQPPMADELVDAIAKHEAQAATHNLEGERHD